jgi:hypothetical protein
MMPIVNFLLRIASFCAGLSLVLWVLLSAIRTFVIPRAARDRLARFVFLIMRRIFNVFIDRASNFEGQDQIMALYGPVTVLVLICVWVNLVLFGYTAIYWGAGCVSWADAYRTSGSSLLTLGFASLTHMRLVAIAFSEAFLGMILIALLIAYLPTMYSAFARREALVTMLETRSGCPPSGVEVLKRHHHFGALDHLGELWEKSEVWFAELEESHTSLTPMAFFRSPRSTRSWITAAGTILDAAVLAQTVVAGKRDTRAKLCVKAGTRALNRIGDVFRIEVMLETNSVVTEEDFAEACRELAAEGVPIIEDCAAAYPKFVELRCEY